MQVASFRLSSAAERGHEHRHFSNGRGGFPAPGRRLTRVVLATLALVASLLATYNYDAVGNLLSITNFNASAFAVYRGEHGRNT